LSLQVGGHTVAGEVSTLAKPLVIVARSRGDAAAPSGGVGGAASGGGDDGDGDGDGDGAAGGRGSALGGGDGGAAAERSYDIVAVVRRKFVFHERPQPIVGTLAAAAAGEAAAAAASVAAR